MKFLRLCIAFFALYLSACGGSDSARELQSDRIVEVSAQLNGKWWLLPNLEQARVVLPDRPHTRAEVEARHRGESSISRVREYRLSTNSIGLRGPELGPKAPGVIRIAALGDSVTHGWGVARDEAYPAQLEAELTRRGHRVEVINAGVPASQLDAMEAWCTHYGKRLELDWVIWTRRPNASIGNPTESFVRHARECERNSDARLFVVLPPISTFDPRGIRQFEREAEALSSRFGPETLVLDLTATFHAAQEGRGEILLESNGVHRVLDQESGSVWIEAPVPMNSASAKPSPAMDKSIYTLFESNADVREALFFDEGHPDAEGFVLFARTVADSWESAGSYSGAR